MTFEQIYNSTFKSIYRFFYYKSINSAEVEDLTHEVFMRFYKRYPNTLFDEVEAKKILYGFSRNVYKEWVRKWIKEKRADFLENYDYEVAEETQEEFEDNEYEKRREQQKSMILTGLQHLNPKVRQILEYRFIHGMTRREVAEKLNMKEKDVHTYQKRGIKYLRKGING